LRRNLRSLLARSAGSSSPAPATDGASGNAFEHKDLLSRAAPFLGAMALAIVAYPLPPRSSESSALYAAALLSALIVIGGIALPWHRLPQFSQVLPPFAYFFVIALLREADGGAASAYGVLVLGPVFWLALYGTRRQLAVSIVGVAGVYLLPISLIGAPDYPASEWTRGLLWVCVAPIVGFTVQSLVRQLRERAKENAGRAEELQLSQEQMSRVIVNMTAVTEAARAITRTTDADVARHVICQAASTITRGKFSTLLEPDGEGGLVMTANHGLPGSRPVRLEIDGESSGAAIAFRTRKPLFVRDARTDSRVSQRMQKATGAVSVLFEPVLRNEEVIGVLAVGWDREVEDLEQQARSAMGMLAAETAMTIERADLLTRLEESARTDDLTGLRNRRAWEEELPREMARARRANHPLCVVMLDLDFFKLYNDESGHQAGDSLLRRTTAAWRDELRTSDILARYGGEEFTVALPACALADAKVIVERLRAAMPSGQTVSAGVACWNGRETAEELVGRADAALYEAKRAGRDRLVSAGARAAAS
jgi:diguanylate cyclase (GGDEF)-like protein